MVTQIERGRWPIRGSRCGLMAILLGLGGQASADEVESSVRDSEQLDPKRTEVGVIPAINYNSDFGLGLGVYAVMAKFSPDRRPYAWRLTGLTYATLKTQDGEWSVPIQAHRLQADIPQFIDDRLRLSGSLAFYRITNAGYYGLGNRSEEVAPPPFDENRFFEYERTYPLLEVTLRTQLIDHPVVVGKQRLEFFVGSRLSYNDLFVPLESALAEDLRVSVGSGADAELLTDLLQGTDDHWLWMLHTGLLLDTRDHEFVPSRGTFTELSIRASPGVDQNLSYVGFSFLSAWFFSLVPDRFVLATHVAADALVGSVPLYELSVLGAFNPRGAPGGSTAVRGVVQQRYAGKIKVLGNFEFRARLLPFRFLGQSLNLGALAFVDTGRVWADPQPLTLRDRRLDGPFFEFLLGVGGGLRLQWGQTFLIRADYAYSPTEATTGLYIDIGHIF